MPELGDTSTQALHILMMQRPFFRGLNPQLLQLLTGSALEIKFETGATLFEEGSPASRVVVRVIHTDAELMIARSVCRVLELGQEIEIAPPQTA